MTTSPNLLKEIASNVQEKLLASLAQPQPIEHPGTKGDSTESAWISLFQDYLPTRYRIAKGIVVDYEGNTSKQIDCLIFDAHFTPQIIPSEVSLYIPAEAVHAVFEVKQKINNENLQDASLKVQSVRRLKRTTSPYIGDGRIREAKPVFHILGGLLASKGSSKERLRSSSLHSQLAEFNGDQHLDFVFSAEDGYADLVQSRYLVGTDKEEQIRNKGNPFIVEGKTGISYGMIRLLEELSWQGTVQAVEWQKYLKNLAEPVTIDLPR